MTGKIVIAGGTGFLGAALLDALALDGHELVVLSRRASGGGPGRRMVAWTPDGKVGPWAAEIDGAQVVINLAGEPIAQGRWTPTKKQRILDSRVLATRSLVAAIGGASRPPALLVSGSAVGYYGSLGDGLVTEEDRAGADFLAGVCVRWEEEAMRAVSPITRVVSIRTGLVLERDGGALAKMLPLFRLGAGGRLGSGRQYWSWIHRRDWVDLIRFVLANPTVSGPVNATAPTPVTNAEFTRVLGRVLHRPALLPTPGFALRLLLGEMADSLLLSGQRVVPTKAQGLGFPFKYPGLEAALRAILP